MIATLLFALGAGPQAVPWAESYEAALERGRAEDRLILVHFWLDGRPLSREMLEKTFADPGVVRLARERFVGVRLESRKVPDLFRRLSGSRGGMATCIVDYTEDVISALPGYADADALVRFLTRAGRGYGALRAIREAADRRPDRAAVLFALGEEYVRLDSRRRAETCFRRVVERAGRSDVEHRVAAFSHERLARMSAMRGRNLEAREALEAYRRSGSAGREDRAMVTEALAFSLERKPREALRVLGEARRRFPASVERDQMLLLTGICRHDAGDTKQALATLEGMVREFPGSSWVADAKTRIEHIKNPPPGHGH